MAEKSVCLKCGGTGVRSDGSACDCGVVQKIIIPKYLAIPSQYQSVRFDRSFLSSSLQDSYGSFMEKLVSECVERPNQMNRNLLICAPPNSGKTVFAYTVYGMLYAKGVRTLRFMDIVEARQTLLDYYNTDLEMLELFNQTPIVILKIPMDVPPRFPEIIGTIIERRVRSGHSTIFLYDGTGDDLLAQDRFGKLKSFLGDGSYHSIELKSWKG